MKLKQEFDFSILCESRKRKESLTTHMIDRILSNEEGKPILSRPQQSESSVDPQLGNNQPSSGVGLQQIGDKSEVYEDSDSQENSSKIVFKEGDDDEPPNSSDYSNEMGQIKSILKKRNSQNSNPGASTTPFKTPHVTQSHTGYQAMAQQRPRMDQTGAS